MIARSLVNAVWWWQWLLLICIPEISQAMGWTLNIAADQPDWSVSALDEPFCASEVTAFIQNNKIILFLSRTLKKKKKIGLFIKEWAFHFRRVLDLQIYCKESTKSSYIPQFPLLLTFYLGMVHLSQWTSTDAFLARVHTSFSFPLFSLMSSPAPAHHLTFSRHVSLGPLLVVGSFSDYLFLKALPGLRSTG